MLLRKLSILLLAAAMSGLFACKDDDDRTAEIAAKIKADLDAYKANTLGDKLKSTASGLEYIIHEQGTGASVKDGDFVPTHYYGVLKSTGVEFDNSFTGGGDPPTFRVGDLIDGFNEGMKLLNRGGKATLFIPWQLGYGANGSGSIPAKADLVFYIELN